MLFILKQQHYTLTKVKKVKSYFTTPLKCRNFQDKHEVNANEIFMLYCL